MSCGSFGIAQILIGLHQIGVVGLQDVFKASASSALREREALLDLFIERLAADNYIPQQQIIPYRLALWREYLRFRGEDFSDFYSEVEVVVRGEEGAERDLFVQRLESVLGDFELRPLITFAPAEADGPYPQLLIHDEPIVRGMLSRRSFKTAVRKNITDW